MPGHLAEELRKDPRLCLRPTACRSARETQAHRTRRPSTDRHRHGSCSGRDARAAWDGDSRGASVMRWSSCAGPVAPPLVQANCVRSSPGTRRRCSASPPGAPPPRQGPRVGRVADHPENPAGERLGVAQRGMPPCRRGPACGSTGGRDNRTARTKVLVDLERRVRAAASRRHQHVGGVRKSGISSAGCSPARTITVRHPGSQPAARA